MGTIPYAGHQYRNRISGYDNGPRFAAPLMGGASFEFLTEDLGVEADRVAEWIAERLVE